MQVNVKVRSRAEALNEGEAPVAAWLRLTPACRIRCVAIPRWMICNTGASSSGCTAKRLRNGIGNDSTH